MGKYAKRNLFLPFIIMLLVVELVSLHGLGHAMTHIGIKAASVCKREEERC